MNTTETFLFYTEKNIIRLEEYLKDHPDSELHKAELKVCKKFKEILLEEKSRETKIKLGDKL